MKTEKTAETKPETTKTYFNRGVSKVRMGKYEEAINIMISPLH